VLNVAVLHKRHTVSIRHDLYTQLQNHGKFGESFSDLLSRILDRYDTEHKTKLLTTEANGGLH
jgi:predicted CopG family antitoxin